MVQTHQDSLEEGTIKPFPPQETEKIWHGSPDPQNVLQLHHQSILTGWISAWYGKCSASDRKALKRVVRKAHHITGAKLPAIQGQYNRHVRGKPIKLSETPVTQVIACYLCYHMASGTGAPNLGPNGSTRCLFVTYA